MRAINGYQNKSLAVETLAQPANDEWMQEAIDGCAERDPTLPDRACGYCRYCWALAAEIAGLAGKRLDGRVSARTLIPVATSCRAMSSISSRSIRRLHKMTSWYEKMIVKHR